eukprot:scaffold427305_cov36-Prasinocladus_malaysianus.AAC.1
MHTRSLASMLLKAVIPVTKHKALKDVRCFAELVGGQRQATYANLIECIGGKAALPLGHSGCVSSAVSAHGNLTCHQEQTRPVNISHLISDRSSAITR